MKKCIALVVAAGRGHRFGADIPKQYQELDGRMVLQHSLATFASCSEISAVRVVIHPDDIVLYEQAVKGLDIMPPVNGGATRQESVYKGLKSLKELNPDTVLIHDGARPFIDNGTIHRIIKSLEENKAVIPALPVNDTLKRADNMKITGTVDRENLWGAQTPQGFRFAEIMKAHKKAKGKELTDDAAVAEFSGIDVAIVEGSRNNKKITSYEDILIAQKNMENSEYRTGNGYDVHAFAEGDEVILCGVHIPHNRKLSGHSDADVALHAITDAVLGAIGAGDIGSHFPPSDMKWKGMDSGYFLKHAVNLLKAKGGRIVNVDVTIICQEPKISGYRNEMKENLAKLIGISYDRISVKGTTTEGLGFTGRKEGIAAHASACVTMPTLY